MNSGNTFEPIFDNQSSYSIGCVSIDPNNHNTIWVGTEKITTKEVLLMEMGFIKV